MNNWSIRRLAVDYGSPTVGHEHWIDHLLVVTVGPLRISWTNGTDSYNRLLKAGDHMFMPAKYVHKFEAIEPGGAQWMCIFHYLDAESKGISKDNFDKNA